MSASVPVWGKEINVEKIGGVPFRVYSERPRRIEDLLQFASRWSNRAHVIQGDRSVSFGTLHKMVKNKAAHLSSIGVRANDYVLLLGWNSPDWIANFWACIDAGAIPVLGNGWWSQNELEEALDTLRPVITLADGAASRKMPAGWKLGPWATSAEAEVPSDGLQTVPLEKDEDAPAVVIFTSGTSGRAKAVVLSHRSLLAGLQMLLHITRRLPQQLDETSTDVGLHTGPLFHIGGVQTLLRAMTVGGTLVMPEGKFDPAEALKLIEQHRISRWSAVPTMVSRVLEHPDVRSRNLTSLGSLTVGGAPIGGELLKRIREGLPDVKPRVPTGYGLSENGGQATAASGVDTAQRPGSSGRPLPCVELKIAPRNELPDGEILLRAPTQMLGYHGVLESPIDNEGWLHTGDLGYLDEDGHLWITGRLKDVIIRGGENISPVAVERSLLSIPGVVEAVVFGVPHPDLGEEVMAVVVDQENRTGDELQVLLKATMASFAIPSRWRIQLDPLPTNHTGKVDKAKLSEDERARRRDELERGVS